MHGIAAFIGRKLLKKQSYGSVLRNCEWMSQERCCDPVQGTFIPKDN